MSYLVLARKYRPQTFSQVVGQEHVVRTLKNAILQDRLAHALLFSGIRGVGKTTIARILAKAINCEDAKEAEPCNTCNVCQEITSGRAVDVQEIDAASNRGIDEIRELRENVKFPPARLKVKFYIIDEAHMLTREAFNALLKTLEEPPGHVKFVLATTEPHKIPATILSRCQRYDFRRVAPAKLVSFLKDVCQKEGASISEEALAIIAREAEGSVRDALSLLDQAISSGVKTAEDLQELLGLSGPQLIEALARAIINRDLATCFKLVNQAYEGGADLLFLAEDLVKFFRNLLALKNSSGRISFDLPESELSALRAISFDLEVEELILFFQTLLQGFETLRRSSVPKLSLELMLAKACQINQMVSLDKIFAKINELKDLPYTQVTSQEKAKDNHQTSEKKQSPDKSWEEFINEVKKEKPTLGALLETLEPPDLSQEKIILKLTEHPLLEDKEIRAKLNSLAQKFWQKPLELKFISQESSFSKRQKLVEKPIVQETLRLFGGRIAQVKIYEKE
ncbi:DNA polymerase III, subunits gamma and tau [Thermodesulfatator indicus DSM 15286]|uniref:DNA polymerase III subunit gamma/tau n=1 Tax=Thermodesulfatator indicus (strain DSM 15286 / JCM 11887 / CIR29812) TaxID=667014 RepID=F8A8T7_THEID|nr:DNA polymerase III subunit gamma/tau [Thermodesulfatator indicus]AEH45102.1 DNA polymerase III, subunits gamma and tau [Thermodesulfatator indicus DSM 15286]